MPTKCRLLLKPATLMVMAAIGLAGCHKRAPVATLPPIVIYQPAEPVVSPLPTPPGLPLEPPIAAPDAPPVPPPDIQRDEELFHLGMLYSSAQNPDRNWQRATTFFRQLVREFPDSPLRPAAELVLSLRNEVTQLSNDAVNREQRIKQLTTELERLKQIDADRRKRP